MTESARHELSYALWLEGVPVAQKDSVIRAVERLEDDGRLFCQGSNDDDERPSVSPVYLSFSPLMTQKVMAKLKTRTTRIGLPRFFEGDIVIAVEKWSGGNRDFAVLEVARIWSVIPNDVGDEFALREGFNSAGDYLRTLARIYGHECLKQRMTVIDFRLRRLL